MLCPGSRPHKPQAAGIPARIHEASAISSWLGLKLHVPEAPLIPFAREHTRTSSPVEGLGDLGRSVSFMQHHSLVILP